MRYIIAVLIVAALCRIVSRAVVLTRRLLHISIYLQMREWRRAIKEAYNRGEFGPLTEDDKALLRRANRRVSSDKD